MAIYLQFEVVRSESTPKKHVTIGNPSPIALHTQPGKVIYQFKNDGFQII